MSGRRGLAVVLLAMAGFLAAAPAPAAEQRFPLPDFTNHKIPTVEVPSAPGMLGSYLDLAALVVALAAASYFAIWGRSRRGLFLLSLASLAWFGFWRKGCICSIGSIQNVTLAIFDSSYTVPVTVVAILVLPIVFTLFFGRGFCAAVCPLGAMQELVAIRPVKVPAWLDQALGLFAYVYLGAAVIFAATGAGFLICRFDPYVAMFRLTGSANMLIFGGAMLAIGLFVGRPYCRYLCPLGAIFGICSKMSKWHLQIPPKDCIECRLCEDACPYGAIRAPTKPRDAAGRIAARQRLTLALLAAPLLVAACAWLGNYLGVAMAKMEPAVRLAERVRLEETHQVEGTIDASDAFRNTGRPTEDLYRAAMNLIARYGWLGVLLGGWTGLVVAAKLIFLCLGRQSKEFAPDQAACVSCGRCFWYCPPEQARLGWIQEGQLLQFTTAEETP